MGTNKLVLSGLLSSLVCFSVIGCKQSSGDSSRTSIRKGTTSSTQKKGTDSKTQAVTDADKKRLEAEAQLKKKAGVSTAENPEQHETGEIDPKKSKTTQSLCSELEASAKEYGWKIESVTDASKKIKITYYVLEESVGKFSNPVIYFNRSAFQKIKTEDLKKFKELYESYKIDPILMDMRGNGCSSTLPDIKTKTSELNNYGSQFAVQDAELVRKKLEITKWKIMAHKSGGVVALRYVQNAPASVKSLHIADFAPVKNQTELMKLRLKQEVLSWDLLLKETKLTQDEIDKAVKNLGTDKDLLDIYALDLTDKTKWSSIASDIKALADGTKKGTELKERLLKLKQVSTLVSISRISDLDENRSLTACTEALKVENKGTINSCRLEKLTGQGDLASIKNSINHNALNFDAIKANLKKGDIDYSLFQAKLSTQYPPNAYIEHEKAMGDLLKTNSIIDVGSEIYLDEAFLKTLR